MDQQTKRSPQRAVVWAVFLGVVLAALPALASGTAGALDTGFGSSGLASADWDTTASAPLAVQGDGKVILAATDRHPDDNARALWRVRRLTTSGALDTNFGTNGETRLFGDHGSDWLRHMVVDASDRIVLTGRVRIAVTITSGNGRKQKTTTSYVNRLTVARLTSGGALDSTFGTGGVVHTALPGASSGGGSGEGLAIAANGDIVVAGGLIVASSSSSGGKGKKGGGGTTTTSAGICVLRYDSAGDLVTSFGTDGITVDDLTTGDDDVYPGAVGVQSTGHIIVGGRVSASSEQWVLTRYDSDGAKDTSFGRVSIDGQYLRGMLIDGSDRIVACGYLVGASGEGEVLVSRHAATGAVDTGFGTSGLSVVAIGDRSEASGLALQSDGKIVVGAATIDGVTGDVEVGTLRLTASGSLDSGYGVSGIGDASGASDSILGSLSPVVLDGNGDAIFAGMTQYAAGGFAIFVGRWCGG